MMHDIRVVSVPRRIFGLARVVWVVRCLTCPWRAEFPDAHAAAVMTRHHTSGHAA